MYEEIVKLADDLMGVVHTHYNRGGVNGAEILGTLDNTKHYFREHLEKIEIEKERLDIIVDDEGPGMTIVEKNLESS